MRIYSIEGLCNVAEISDSIESVKFDRVHLPDWTSSTLCEFVQLMILFRYVLSK